MKILFCNYEYPPLGGGGGVVNAQIAIELAKRHDVTVLTSQGFGLPKEEIVDGVRIIRVPVFFRQLQAAANFASMLAYLPKGMKAGKALLSKEKFDIINTHFVLPTGPVGDYLASYANIPNVLSVHGGDLYDPSKWLSPHRHFFLRKWVKALLKKASVVVGQSRNTIQNVKEYYLPEMTPMIIPLGIPRPPKVQASRQTLGFNDSDILLVTVGRLVARKAVDQLIQLIKNLGRDDVRLIIIGSGPQEESLRNLAKQLSVQDKIRFMGFIEEDEKNKLLNIADLYVSTSQHEGFGLVYLEAMATENPVVCYDYGGQTDFLENNRTGCLVKLNDEAEFLKQVETLIENPQLRTEMSQYCVEKVEEYYIDNCAKKYEKLFEELISQSLKL